MHFSVAMATYNGVQYLPEQLVSLTKQTELPCELVICDDCSSDNTIELLLNFSKTAPFPVHVIRNKSNCGFTETFLRAARHCKGDAIAFCDQDDVWLSNKIADASAAFRRNPGSALILQRAELCNADLTRSNGLFPAHLRTGFHSPNSQFGFWVWPGFLQTVRRQHFLATDGIPRPRSYFPGHASMPHDKLTCLIANTSGGFSVLPGAVALYRRHEAALTGFYSVQTMSERIDKALSVGGAHYSFLSEVAAETAIYLDGLAQRNSVIFSGDCMAAANRFRQLSCIQALRAKLYLENSLSHRLTYMTLIASKGGYIGPRMLALGWKSAIKDFLVAIGYISRPQKLEV